MIQRVTGGKRNETVDQLLVRVKHDAQLWHDLLFYDFDKDGVLLMKKIGDLVITLENEKG